MINRYINIRIFLSPIRGKGRTQRMRCLPFWTRFFHLTLRERKHQATQLINAMHADNEKARAAALAKMEEGRLTLWASTQTPFPLKEQAASLLGIAPQNVHVITPYVGGGFGGGGGFRGGGGGGGGGYGTTGGGAASTGAAGLVDYQEFIVMSGGASATGGGVGVPGLPWVSLCRAPATQVSSPAPPGGGLRGF